MYKINWLAWDKESFAKAKKENKPILLDISAVWCYWCHRLDEDTYDNEEVIKFINNNFIPIRVDTDKRPDINTRYNLGGWPTTAILDIEGEIISGAMYLSPYQMLSFLENALSIYKESNKKIQTEFIQQKFENKDLNKIKEDIFNEIKINYDPYFGGFGSDQKFPFHNILEFLLELKDSEAKEILIKTLTNMAAGEIFDKEEYGFYRYATQQNWSKPHYEKLLDDNSRLISTYLLAYKLTNIEKFKETAQKTIAFILSNFLDKEKSYFYSSQDADEEYYKLPLKARQKLKKPNIDKILFLDFNCYAINSFLLASEMLNNEEYEGIALNALNFLLKNLINNEGVLHFYDTSPSQSYLLKNHLLLITSLLNTNQEKYIKKAEEIMQLTITNFFNKDVFYDIKESDDNLGYLKIRKIDPEQNSLAIKVLINLYKKTNKKEYFELAQKTISSVKEFIDPHSLFSSSFAESIMLYKNLDYLK
ncbi:thioredoxin domain-containing protein [Candidatus Woesearchaeota archaeon]|nr:thioredoxin domain-containing protein [Candidatus Woesearchaeota archaeon]